MRLTSRDFHWLRQAADVADAQRELVEIMKRSENRPHGQNRQADAGLIAAALALIFVITLAALTEAPEFETLAYNGEPRERVVSLE